MSKVIVTLDDEPCEVYQGRLTHAEKAQVFDTMQEAEKAIQSTLQWAESIGALIRSVDDEDENGISARTSGYRIGGFRIYALK